MEFTLSELNDYGKLKINSQLSLVKDKIAFFESKYKQTFSLFESKLNEQSENFEVSDDYIEWKALENSMKSLEHALKEVEDVRDIKIIKE